MCVPTDHCPPLNELLVQLNQFYDALTHETRRLDERHSMRLQCHRGCRSCCVDELTVFEIEAAHIRHHHGDLLARGTPHPAGACAFLDCQGACRIYAHRPYVCRTQGYPLRWVDEDEAGDLVEYRDICPMNER